MEEASVDAIVTDPPYGLAFMGRAWDRVTEQWHREWAAQALRVLKPGGHLLAFGSARTYHRLACAVEDAGFEIRDQIMWVYGSGFPKSLDVSKAIDKGAGAERTEVVGRRGLTRWEDGAADGVCRNPGLRRPFDEVDKVYAPATAAARQWEGWGTALKPAHEPIVVARKPLVGTVVDTVLRWGTGAINIDATRVAAADGASTARTPAVVRGDAPAGFGRGAAMGGAGSPLGRWPSNLIHDGSPEVVDRFPETGGDNRPGRAGRRPGGFADVGAPKGSSEPCGPLYADSGSAARFFYVAKASKAERGDGNLHPTVKPVMLMRYLIRLVVPPGGLLLDPFLGSGTTALAAESERVRWIGIEENADYAQIARERLARRAATRKVPPPIPPPPGRDGSVRRMLSR